MAKRYYLRLPDPQQAHGERIELAFRSVGPAGIAEELQAALRSPDYFERWRQQLDDPDGVEAGLGATDAQAQVIGQQADLHIDLTVTTELPAQVIRHRLTLLAGKHWQLRDVTFA